jgi:serine/threonine protein kinase
MTSPSAPSEPTTYAFERLALLARGATSRIELCRIVQGEPYGAVVAVKRLPADMVEDPELRATFRDEIWMASSLSHPNVARVIGWGEDGEGPFLLSEFVRGVSLSRLSRTVFSTGEAFTDRLVVYLSSCVCAGLEAAHDLRSPDGQLVNLVHRDLTPGNILLGFDGSVKITDFGLAKAKYRSTHTAVGMTKGRPGYMSPEQVLGAELDRRTDLFVLGVVMFELLGQRLPWDSASTRSAITSVVEALVPDLRELNPKLDASLVGIVKRCLAKEKDDRFQSAGALEAELDEWLLLNGYEDNAEALGRFVRRNALRQQRWIERALSGKLAADEQLSGPWPVDSARELASEPYASTPPEDTGGSISATGHAPGEISDLATTARRQRVEAAAGPKSLTAPTAPHALGASGAQARGGYPKSDEEPSPETSSYRRVAPPAPVPPRPPQAPAGIEDPPTLRRSVRGDDLRESAQGVVVGAGAVMRRAKRVAEEARAAAQRAEAAAQAARSLAERAEKAAEAVRLASEAMLQVTEGDAGAALETLERAARLLEAATGDEG